MCESGSLWLRAGERDAERSEKGIKTSETRKPRLVASERSKWARGVEIAAGEKLNARATVGVVGSEVTGIGTSARENFLLRLLTGKMEGLVLRSYCECI